MKKTYIAPAITELKMENNAIMAASGPASTGGNIGNLESAGDPFGESQNAKFRDVRSDLWEE